MMPTYLQMVRQDVDNEQGAEIVEWVLWVGGIALLATALYAVVSGTLSTVATNIISNMGSISGS